MQPKDFWFKAFIEVASDGISNKSRQFLQRVGFGEDGFTKSACRVTTFRRLFHQKDNLVHVSTPMCSIKVYHGKPDT